MDVLERPDERGIDPRWVREVPDEAQSRLASAFPELRVLWNNAICKFQTVMRAEGCVQVFLDGTLEGWELMGEFDPPLDIESIIATLRGRQRFVAWNLRKAGYGTENDSDADVLNAYLDDAPRLIEEASEKAWQEAADDYFDGPLARARDEDGIAARRGARLMDLASGRRAHTPYKLVVPANPAGVARMLKERVE